MLFSGMSTMVVTPPAAAARVAVSNPSHSVRPGSFTWTCVSTTPGSTARVPTSRYRAASGASPCALTDVITPPVIATAAGTTPWGVTTRVLEMTRSARSIGIDDILTPGVVARFRDGWEYGRMLSPFALMLAAQQPLTLQPCRLAPIEATARCGTYWVYEDRARGVGRKIPLKVIILPARRPPSAPDPMLVVSPGGPGTTNSETGVALASVAAWRDNRDVVLVDLRGTSGPNRLDCRMPGSDDHPEGYLATAFPDPSRELAAVVERLKQRPADVAIPDSAAGAPITARLTWQQFAEALRVMTYNLATARRVPMVVHQAYLGDLTSFVRTGIASNRGLRTILRLGFLLSVTCTEDVPRITSQDIERETAGTYPGDLRVREQQAACAEWPHGALPPGYGDPVRSDVPVFLLSGTVDPVSPPQFAAEAA